MGAGFCRCNFFIRPVWRPPDCGSYFRRDLGPVFMGHFALLRQMADSLILWLMVCIGVIMLPWLLLMKLLANTAAQ